MYFKQKILLFTMYCIRISTITSYIYAKKSRKYFFLDFFCYFFKNPNNAPKIPPKLSKTTSCINGVLPGVKPW